MLTTNFKTDGTHPFTCVVPPVCQAALSVIRLYQNDGSVVELCNQTLNWYGLPARAQRSWANQSGAGLANRHEATG